RGAWTSFTLREAAGRSCDARLRARCVEDVTGAQPGRSVAWRRNAARGGGVGPWGDPGDSSRVRRRVPQWFGSKSSQPRGEAALGQLIVVRRVDINQQIWRKVQDHGPLAVPVQD